MATHAQYAHADYQRLRETRRGWSLRRAVRLRLAASYENLIARPSNHAGALTARVPVLPTAVTVAKGELLDIAARLRAQPEPPADGVRAARRLLTDGTGPLYVAADNEALRIAARHVLAQLAR